MASRPPACGNTLKEQQRKNCSQKLLHRIISWAGGPDENSEKVLGAPYAGFACGVFDFSFWRGTRVPLLRGALRKCYPRIACSRQARRKKWRSGPPA